MVDTSVCPTLCQALDVTEIRAAAAYMATSWIPDFKGLGEVAETCKWP